MSEAEIGSTVGAARDDNGDDVGVTEAAPGLVVTTETAWDPPSRRTSRLRWLSVIMNLLSPSSYSASQDLSSGEPRWRLVLADEDGQQWAESSWRRDWDDVERLQAEWNRRLQEASPEELAATVWRWRGE